MGVGDEGRAARCSPCLLGPCLLPDLPCYSPGRGYNFGDARHGPCGVAPVEPGNRIGWAESSIQQIEVQVIGAAGGGVIVDRWSCVRNGDEENPHEPILPIEGNLRVKVPDFDFQVYRLFVRTPSIRCRGEATMQL